MDDITFLSILVIYAYMAIIHFKIDYYVNEQFCARGETPNIFYCLCRSIIFPVIWAIILLKSTDDE